MNKQTGQHHLALDVGGDNHTETFVQNDGMKLLPTTAFAYYSVRWE